MGSILNLTGSGVRKITVGLQDADLAFRCYAIWVEAAGNLEFVADDGETQTIALPVGEFPIRCTRVNSAGTTATVWAILNSAG